MAAVGWWPRKICRHLEIIVLYDLPNILEPYPSRPRKRTLLSNFVRTRRESLRAQSGLMPAFFTIFPQSAISLFM
jgi:hypothetical protein